MSGFGLGFGFAYVRSILSRVAATEIFTANVADFDGTTYASLISPNITGDFSFYANVYPDTTGAQQTLFQDRFTWPSNEYGLYVNRLAGNQVRLHRGLGDASGNYRDSTATLNVGAWNTVGISYKQSTGDIIFDINGVQETIASGTGTLIYTGSTTKVSFGSSSVNTQKFNGGMDLIGIWSVAKTSAELTELHNGGQQRCLDLLSTGLKVGLNHFYNLAEWTGPNTPLTDLVGSNDATAVGALVYTKSAQILCEEYVPSVNDMLMTIDTTQAGSASDTFIFPLTSMGGLASIQIAWGDGSSSVITSVGQAELTHVYAVGGVKNITVIGAVGYEWAFVNAGDKSKLISIEQWGASTLRTSHFHGCDKFVEISATDIPQATSINGTNTFLNCVLLSTINKVNEWDTSNYNNMASYYSGCSVLSIDIPDWNVAIVTGFNSFAVDATLFNTNITSWNLSSAITVSLMLASCAMDSASIDGAMQAFVNSGKASLSTSVAGGTNLGFASWSAGAVTNYNTLIANGWTIATNA